MTQWWNEGTKDTAAVSNKRVVMGRDSHGVLLLIALAALAALAGTDAFSTESKFIISLECKYKISSE